jgi:hypothetical protein
MKLNIGRLLGKIATAAKNNPEIALAVVGLAAPKLVKKAAPVLITLATKRQA